MVTIVKHEWHQVDSQFALELDESILSDIYPDLDDDEIAEKLRQIENGEIDVDEIVNDAYENDVDLDWDRQYDDWWTDRKGGYDVTYELGDEDSWHYEPQPDPPYYNCTKCRWEGNKWAGRTAYCREDDSIIPDDVDEEHHHTKEVCPMCDSDLKLTEFGEKEKLEDEERERRWREEDITGGDDDEEYNAECTSCNWTGPEIDTITIEGQMCCPDCREPVYTAEQVAERREYDLNQALEELKTEFETLITSEESAIQPMKCTNCDWHGDWTDTSNNEEGEDICPECSKKVVDVDE